MEPFRTLDGLVTLLDLPNVDTDQIIPKQFLKRIERTGYEDCLFFDWRFTPDGKARPDFVLNQLRYKGASILLARANFGCGSSREHAPWALWDYGFRVIMAPSFADIFYSNCIKNGLLPVRLTETEMDELFRLTEGEVGYELTIDLGTQTVSHGDHFSTQFSIDPFHRECLLGGLDEISLTLKQEEKIRAYELNRLRRRK
jgi:3-isopropylmalate/(R)-2-methylmalate dehydratase small subunit